MAGASAPMKTLAQFRPAFARPDRPERTERTDRPDRPDRSARSARSAWPARPASLWARVTGARRSGPYRSPAGKPEHGRTLEE
ncbi:hypothetical protein GA0115257_112822 [Streptomyces sp. LcepLS]|nr:hypothetical protein GA0115257_112822 [Streptomyces sp. LcepLS]